MPLACRISRVGLAQLHGDVTVEELLEAERNGGGRRDVDPRSVEALLALELDELAVQAELQVPIEEAIGAEELDLRQALQGEIVFLNEVLVVDALRDQRRVLPRAVEPGVRRREAAGA
jgi:hypothetical protein